MNYKENKEKIDFWKESDYLYCIYSSTLFYHHWKEINPKKFLLNYPILPHKCSESQVRLLSNEIIFKS